MTNNQYPQIVIGDVLYSVRKIETPEHPDGTYTLASFVVLYRSHKSFVLQDSVEYAHDIAANIQPSGFVVAATAIENTYFTTPTLAYQHQHNQLAIKAADAQAAAEAAQFEVLRLERDVFGAAMDAIHQVQQQACSITPQTMVVLDAVTIDVPLGVIA